MKRILPHYQLSFINVDDDDQEMASILITWMSLQGFQKAFE